MKRFLCIGDSLTYGYDVAFSYRWTTIVAKELSIHIDNEGQCGDTAQGVFRRLQQLDLSRYDGYFVMAGSNDILLDVPLMETKAAMEAIGSLLDPFHKAVYIGVPPVTTKESALYGWQQGFAVERHNAILEQYGRWLHGWALQRGYTIVDFSKALQDEMGLVYADGVHPNEKGYALVAKTFIETLTNCKNM